MLGDKRAIVGHDTSGRALLSRVLDQRSYRGLIGAVGRLEFRQSGGVRRFGQLTSKLADACREMRRPGSILAVPEGHPRGRAWRRYHDHAIVLDALDAPRGRAELKN